MEEIINDYMENMQIDYSNLSDFLAMAKDYQESQLMSELINN